MAKPTTCSGARSLRLRAPRATAGRRGFTLSELAVVLAVIAILAGLAVPSLGWLAGAEHDVATTRTRNALIFAQRWAVATRRATWAEFDLSGDALELFAEGSAGAGAGSRVPLLDPLTRDPYRLEFASSAAGFASVRLGDTEGLRFDPEGAPSSADGSALTEDGRVQMDGGDVVRIVRDTGLVLVE